MTRILAVVCVLVFSAGCESFGVAGVGDRAGSDTPIEGGELKANSGAHEAVKTVTEGSGQTEIKDRGENIMAKNLLLFKQGMETGGWEPFRAGSAPQPLRSVTGKGQSAALVLQSGSKRTVNGGWKRTIQPIKAGQHYKVSIDVAFDDLEDPMYRLWVRVYWRGKDRPVEADADNLTPVRKGKKLHFENIVQAPEGTQRAEVFLLMRWAPNAKVRWTSASFTPCAPPKPRKVKISTIYWRPTGPKQATVESNVKNFLRMIDRAAKGKPDLIVLTEAMTAVAVATKPLHTVPGPVYDAFAAAAKKHKTNMVFSLFEKAPTACYTTAFLVDRKGKLIGRYRKTHLPVGEDSGGFTPGNRLDVFEADFGKVAMEICIETSFPEISRIYALKGAEIIVAPCWGASVACVQARAHENGVYVVTAGFDVPSMIINPMGKILASTWKDHGNGVATATIDLSKPARGTWVGNFPDYLLRMRRTDLYDELLKRGPGS